MNFSAGLPVALLLGGALLAPRLLATNSAYAETILVANSVSYHPTIAVNPEMLDAWGIAVRPPGAGGHFWINNAFYGTSVEYIGDVGGVALHQDGLTSVTLDTPRFTDHGYAFTTGLVYNAAKDLPGQALEFPVSGPAQNDSTTPPTAIPGGTSGAAAFIFVTEDGCINAWRSSTAVAMVTAPVIVDYSKTSSYFPYAANSVFSGAAISVHASNSSAYLAAGGNHLYATDFRQNAIQVFDNQWKDVTASYHFQTPADLPADLHAFNIMDLDGHLYVTYAKWKASGDEGMEEEDGPGLGRLVEYNEDGTLVQEFHDQGRLNAPWGVAIAPATFGAFAHDVLVSNFGDGTIAAFDPATGDFVGQLKDASGAVLSIEGIWGLVFGNGVSLGDANTLYFTAGPNAERDGLFGKITLLPDASDTPVLNAGGLVTLGAFLAGGAVWTLTHSATSQAWHAARR